MQRNYRFRLIPLIVLVLSSCSSKQQVHKNNFVVGMESLGVKERLEYSEEIHTVYDTKNNFKTVYAQNQDTTFFYIDEYLLYQIDNDDFFQLSYFENRYILISINLTKNLSCISGPELFESEKLIIVDSETNQSKTIDFESPIRFSYVVTRGKPKSSFSTIIEAILFDEKIIRLSNLEYGTKDFTLNDYTF